MRWVHKRRSYMLTVGNVAAKVFADDDMPGGPVAAVDLLLDIRRNVLLDVVLSEGGSGDVDDLLLHLFRHINVLDDGLWCIGHDTVCGRGHFVFVGHGGMGQVSQGMRAFDRGGTWSAAAPRMSAILRPRVLLSLLIHVSADYMGP